MTKKAQPATKQRASNVNAPSDQLCSAISTWKVSQNEIAQLKALAGSNGFDRRQLCSDLGLIQHAANTLASALAKGSEGNLKGARWLRLETFDDGGMEIIDGAVIRSRYMLDQTAKLLKELKLSAVMYVPHRLLYGHPKIDRGRALLTTCRALAFTKSDFDETLTKAKIEKWRELSSRIGIKTIRQNTFKAADLAKGAAWLFNDDSTPMKFVEDQNDDPCLKLSEKPLKADALLRLLEVRSQAELGERFSGIGIGQAVANELRSKLLSWQKGRVEEGEILPLDFDVWAFWAKLRQKHGPKSYLPLRFDSPTKRLTKPPRRSRNGRPLGPPRGRGKHAPSGKRTPKPVEADRP